MYLYVYICIICTYYEAVHIFVQFQIEVIKIFEHFTF